MNGHATADKDETNCRWHHDLLEQIGQLVDLERVLVCENDQLRSQLVEMKVNEKKKYDDLMVQYYNMKREYEDDGLDKQGTSNNQVTVKTESIDEDVKAEIKEPDEMANHDGSLVGSNEPSNSARPRSNRVTSKQSTASTARKLTKRKQSQPSQTVKRSKKTIQNDEEDVDIANKDREESKIKVLHLNCTLSDCNVLSWTHWIICTITCSLCINFRRFNVLPPIAMHDSIIKDRFVVTSNSILKVLDLAVPFVSSNMIHKRLTLRAYDHWHRIYLTGKFLCNLVTDCGEVTHTRGKMKTHQMQIKHHSQSKHFQGTQPGCTASFAFKDRLKQHGLTHLDSTPFHCGWPKCREHYKRCSHLIGHIRVQHFGLPKTMKKQKKRNIVDVRDPNEYVRVVVDE